MSSATVLLYRFETDEEVQIAAKANDPSVAPEVSQEHVREGRRGLRVWLGRKARRRGRPGGEYLDRTGRVRMLCLPNPRGQDWSAAGALHIAVFNPHDELFALDLDILDGQSEGYHRGYYEPRWHLLPGWTELVVNLGESFRRGEHREGPMDRRDLRMIQMTVRGALWGERELYLGGAWLAPGEVDEEAALAAGRPRTEPQLEDEESMRFQVCYSI